MTSLEESAPKTKKAYYKCCVIDCQNDTNNSPNLQFYKFPTSNVLFPHKLLRRKNWLNSVRLQNSDGSAWEPGKRSRLCSEHFIGDKKSDDPRSPSYNPTIFPQVYKRRTSNARFALNRYERFLKRSSDQKNMCDQSKKCKITDTVEESLFDNCNTRIQVDEQSLFIDNNREEETESFENDIEIVQKKDKETYVNFLETDDNSQMIFMCNRYINTIQCEAETLVCTPVVKEKVKIVYIERKEAERAKEEKNEEAERVKSCDAGFHGLSSIKQEQELIDLCGVSSKTFELLFKILSKGELDKRMKISCENKLLIFLMKMKLGLTFSALSALFDVHRSTASRLFYSALEYLAPACKNFVRWPEKYVVQETMPSVFKPDYSQCRVIIDSTEFVVQQPTTIEQRVQFHSHYKKGFRIKNVIGCLPSGLICLISKCHGGRATDAQITISSGLLDLLEPGDIVLADKGFPQIKTLLDKQGKNVLVVMPPFLHNQHFTEEEVNTTYKVGRVRIHIERIMQRIRTYKIVDKFTIDMLPYCDDIIFICCVLVNLQPPIIIDKENSS